jgi:hypothetical protein
MSRYIIAAATIVVAIAAVPVSAQSVGVAKAAAGALRRGTTPVMLPGTKESAFTTIQGNALSSTNGQLANSVVRLRDARLGRIVDTQVTDRSGLFAFRAVDPGNYVVELMAPDQTTVLSASQVLSVNAGDAVSAIVRLPFRIPPFAGLLGNSAPQAATVSSAAAASGVLAEDVITTPTAVLSLRDESPR